MKLFKFVFKIVMLCSFATFSHAAAYMKLGDIEGEATDRDHREWINILSMSSPALSVYAEIGASGQCGVVLQGRGDTTLDDIVVVRELDKSSTKLQEAACNEEFFSEAVIDLVSTDRRGEESYLRYKLIGATIKSYSISPGINASGESVPMESLTINYTTIDADYSRP